ATGGEQVEKWIEERLSGLGKVEQRVLRWVDGPALAKVMHPSAVVIDPESEKRLRRAGSEANSMYNRAHNALEALRKRAATEPPPAGPPKAGAPAPERNATDS